MSRHPQNSNQAAASRHLRLGALVLASVAITQVYDTLGDASVMQQVLYWLVRHGTLAAGLWSADALVARLLANRFEHPAWLKPVVLVSVLGVAPMALAETLMEPHLPVRPEFADDDLWAYSPALAFLSEWATHVTIIVPVHMLLWLIVEWGGRRRSDTTEQEARSDSGVLDVGAHEPTPVETESLPPFLERTPGVVATDVLALQAEEHYVRIYLQGTAELVLYRFGDAVSEIPKQLGSQVHRSWWVADRAVRSAKRGARRWQLDLVCDVAVPVSDSYIQVVRERGWLRRRTAASKSD